MNTGVCWQRPQKNMPWCCDEERLRRGQQGWGSHPFTSLVAALHKTHHPSKVWAALTHPATRNWTIKSKQHLQTNNIYLGSWDDQTLRRSLQDTFWRQVRQEESHQALQLPTSLSGLLFSSGQCGRMFQSHHSLHIPSGSGGLPDFHVYAWFYSYNPHNLPPRNLQRASLDTHTDLQVSRVR